MNYLLPLLAQVKQLNSDTPRVQDPGNTGTLWVIVAFIVVLTLLITFKTARRNNPLLDDLDI